MLLLVLLVVVLLLLLMVVVCLRACSLQHLAYPHLLFTAPTTPLLLRPASQAQPRYTSSLLLLPLLHVSLLVVWQQHRLWAVLVVPTSSGQRR